ncbi:hypothetical protein [Paenibacillus sp. GCM10023250]|uniref:hypothetical protein n=1 Tax=Paenibacillus sp. GCM10023250 TaxID=3252648 RepID=UPI00361B2BED
MRTNLQTCIRKPGIRGVASCSLIAFLAFLLSGCVPAPKSTIPIADIAVTNNHLILINETGYIWYDAKLTIDGKYTYKASMITAGKSGIPLAKFVDDQGHAYKRDRLSIRNLKIDITDTLGREKHFTW